MAWVVFASLLLAIGAMYIANWHIDHYAEKFVFDDYETMPVNKVGLLLGTSKRLRDGSVNLYFKYRIEAAINLYNAGKIKYIIVSGDNSQIYYNEPIDMKKALLKGGIPPEAIYLDYAGFRTLDSVVRGKKIFGQQKLTIISQEFHNKRAIFIANRYGIEAIGFNARDVSISLGFKTQMREKFARLMTIFDLYLLNTQPKFLGESIQIGLR
ncbi:MAG: YdcF family protein [Microscillaceae bacterium]|jgi:SanA protein|nr:YdcF family protein [Microscillaceae bacterium]